MAGTYQEHLGSFPWQGTDSLATYAGTVVQPYSSVNLMTNEVALNNNLYSVYSMLYYTDLRVIDIQDRVMNHVMPDMQVVKYTLQNATFSNYSAKLASIEQKIDSLGGDGMTYDGVAIVGVLLAVIFAVTWKG